MKNNQAFTLIELLVVVLIIGILAAVALPQYQKAVDKSRMSNLITIAKTVMDAQETYYLSNGQYTDDWEQLSIGFQGSIYHTNTWYMSNGIKMILAADGVMDMVMITDSRLPDIQLAAGYPHTGNESWSKYWRCYALSTNERAKRLCQLVTNRKNRNTTSQDSDIYYFPGMPY